MSGPERGSTPSCVSPGAGVSHTLAAAEQAGRAAQRSQHPQPGWAGAPAMQEDRSCPTADPNRFGNPTRKGDCSPAAGLLSRAIPDPRKQHSPTRRSPFPCFPPLQHLSSSRTDGVSPEHLARSAAHAHSASPRNRSHSLSPPFLVKTVSRRPAVKSTAASGKGPKSRSRFPVLYLHAGTSDFPGERFSQQAQFCFHLE